MVENLERKESKSSIISYCMADLLIQTYGMAFGAFFFLFWETEVGLNVWIITIAYTIYAIWNAINDPLIGYFVDRPKKFWKKWGKRFPWIMISGIPTILFFVGIFSPPNLNPISDAWILFTWLFFFLFFYELFVSIFSLNHMALFPDKFRVDSDRRKIGTTSRTFILIGTAFGSIIPPLFITYGDRQSYSNMAWIIAVISIIMFFTVIPGHLESKEMKERYIEEQSEKEKVSFLHAFKIVLTSKNFVVVILIFFADGIIGLSLSASIQYVTKYILEEEAAVSIFLMVGFIIGVLVSIFFWLMLAQRMKNNRRMLILGAFLNTILLFPFMFVQGLMGFILAAFLLGIGGGALRVGQDPVLADTIDEATVRSGKHMEGAFMGVRIFFLRLGIIVQGFIFAITHQLTGFDPNSNTQTELAKLGIRIHTALIPMILTLIALVIFIFVYDLTPEKTKELKEKMKELNL
ncbi:MAG: MFS transporter [Promethearchaeota archaeon]